MQPGTSPTVPTTPSPDVVADRASIAVNGEVHELFVGDKFPQTDPAFELVAVANRQVTIGLANGSFASRQQTITLKLGKSVTLISQPDGARFTLKLVSVGSNHAGDHRLASAPWPGAHAREAATVSELDGGVLRVTQPLPWALDHVHCYALA